MNKKLLHFNKTKDSYIKILFFSLFIVMSFGFYKNIFKLLNEGIAFKEFYGIVMFPFIGILFGLLADYIEEKKFYFGFNSIIGLTLSAIIPVNTDVILFAISLSPIVLLSFFKKNSVLNKICISKIILIILLLLFHSYQYQNILEASFEYDYSLFDVFIGNQVGGAFSTSVLFIFIGYIVLALNPIYKKIIAPISFLFYIISIFIIILINKSFENINFFLSSANIFSFVFIAPFSLSSPTSKKHLILYSIFIGLLTGVLIFLFNSYDSGIIAILIVNIFYVLFKKLSQYDKNRKSNVL